MTVRVPLAGGGYDVVIGEGLLLDLATLLRERCPAAAYAVISDDVVGDTLGAAVVARLGKAGLRAELLTFPHGEASKTRETWAALSDQMLARHLGRDAAVVALGGGVVGDLAGFVAATYLRGIPYVQAPTTLLAMIDASIGGKTGVDVPAGKNLIGAFHQPRAVIADIATLRALPAKQRIRGIAEAIKHGVIADASYFALLEGAQAAIATAEPTDLVERVVAGSVMIKTRIVAEDEREAGLRAILNFGHTIGHAIEAASGFGVAHGEAIAIGMVAEARLAERLGVAQPGTADRIRAAVESYALPTEMPRLEPAALLAAMGHDKKVRNGTLRLALPVRIGAMAPGDEGRWTVPVTETDVCSVF